MNKLRVNIEDDVIRGIVMELIHEYNKETLTEVAIELIRVVRDLD